MNCLWCEQPIGDYEDTGHGHECAVAAHKRVGELEAERDALLEALRQIAGVDARRYNPPLTGHEVIATMRDLARAALRKELRND